MYDLATHLQEINEATTMDAVSFIPAQLGVVQSALKKLAQEKLDWDIEILEGDEEHCVTFGKRLKVNVPIKDWEEFTSLFGRDIRQDKSINLRGGYNESIVMKPPKFRIALRQAFHAVFKQRKVQNFERVMERWISAFPQSRYLTGKTPAICLETRKKDVTALIHRLVKQYESQESRTSLLSKLKEATGLEKETLFAKHPWFVGTKITSVYEGVSMVFEGSLDYGGSIAISITVHDPEVVEAISADHSIRGVRVKNVFCTNERNITLAGKIKRVIDEMCEDQELEETEKLAADKALVEAKSFEKAERAESKKQKVEDKNAPSN